MFPKEQLGRLDYGLLKHMGLTRHQLDKCDLLFFLQLILPICDPAKSGIKDDPRMPFYSSVEKWSAVYANLIGMGGSYGHSFKNPLSFELVRFDSAVLRDGVHGGSNGGIFRRWCDSNGCYDPKIAASQTHTRWLQIKRCYKLCDNSTAIKPGLPGYNPAYKYDYLFEVICENINALSESADLDLCCDKTTMAHQGPGEAECDLWRRVSKKPGVTKGSQIVLLCDVHTGRPRTYVHRCNQMHREPGFTQQGPAEVANLILKILPMVKQQQTSKRSDGRTRRQLFSVKPAITCDNFFSGDQTMDFCGRMEFGLLTTVRRSRLPRHIPVQHLHKESTPPRDPRAKLARFLNPIIAVQKVSLDPPESSSASGLQDTTTTSISYHKVHVSFQSTSLCNIAGVNMLNNIMLYG